MQEESHPISKLALKGKSKPELQALASRFLSTELFDDMDRPRLIEALSAAADVSEELAQELARTEISVKPSFQLMLLDPYGEQILGDKNAFQELRSVLDELNRSLNAGQELPPYSGFQVHKVTKLESVVFEVRFTWQRIHWYWHPEDFSRRYIYEARFGFALLDFTGRKAIVSCHDRKERDHLAKALSQVFSVQLSSMVLTQPILDRIGRFDSVKRAGYFIHDPPADLPSNITYADENLGSSLIARDEESNFRSQRRQSFYRIPLGELVETGVGVTSDPGKVWVPREVPLTTAREYGLQLLSKISDTLSELAKQGKTKDVLDIVDIARLQSMKTIQPAELRHEVVDLFIHLVNMLVNGETERPFTPSATLAAKGTQGDTTGLFFYPRVEIPDAEEHIGVTFWHDSDSRSQQVKVVSHDGGKLTFAGERSGKELDLANLSHPVTDELIDLGEPLTHLELIPKPRLREALMEAVGRISGQMKELQSVRFLPFYISAGRLRLDVDRALGRGVSNPDPMIYPEELQQIEAELRRDLRDSSERERTDKRLVQLGEKCKHMKDENCQSCVSETEFLCLRSLVARRFNNHLLLAHKGIEQSDVQFDATIEGEPTKVFGFAKMGANKKGLTSRNSHGAILTAQVLSQIRNTDFRIAAVITASTVNEDIREQLKSVCSIFGKRLLILDAPVLRKLLIGFEDEMAFKDIDPADIYKASGI